MRIWVSSLSKVQQLAKDVEPSHIVSLLGRGSLFPIIEGYDESVHHRVALDDIRSEIKGYVTPNEYHVAQLIEFLRQWTPEEASLVVHCWAGISRSSATAFIAACMINPDYSEKEIANEIAAASPTAYPNTLIVSYADKILQRKGRMTNAAEEMCADEERKLRIRDYENVPPFSIPARFS